MRKVERFVCDKCDAVFDTEDECRKHEEVCGELELVEIFLSVNSADGVLIDSAVTKAKSIDADTFLVCDSSDEDGYPITREIKLMAPEVAAVYKNGYDLTIWCTPDQEPEAERKLREYAKTVLRSQSEHLSKMLESLEKLH